MAKSTRTEIALVLIIFLVALLPRVLDLGVFLTADEKNWIGRSYEFVRAFKDWRFNDMMQTTHPGVTTLWLAGVAVVSKILLAHIPFSFQNLIHFVTAAQFPLALANTFLVLVIYWLLRIVFSNLRVVPAVAALLIALNPFLIGYSRVVHVDALLTGLLFAASLATIIWARKGYKQRWLLISAVLTGLAVLTKAPAVFMVPFWILVVLVYHRQAIWQREIWLSRGRDFIFWLLIIGLIFVTLWPAILWVSNPQGNVLTVKRDLSIAAATPHNMTEEYTLNGYHYLFTLLTRTTPVTLGFSVLVVILVGYLNLSRQISSHFPRRPQRGRLREPRLAPLRQGGGTVPARRANPFEETAGTALFLIIAYVFFFVLMMTLGAKKGDRYILPAWPAIDVLAAVGLVWVGSLLRRGLKKLQITNNPAFAKGFDGRGKLQTAVHVLPAGLVLVYLAGVVFSYHPYAIAYSNPLLPDNLSQELGWGEGLEQVGAWLSENDPQAVVASWYPEELGAYTSAHVAHINAHEQPRVHYIVLYRNMFGRAPDHYANDFIDEYYKKLEPVFTATVVGKEFAWVYEKETYERVVGELVPGVHAGQELLLTSDAVGFELLVATYSGRAKVGQLVVEARRGLGGAILQSWRVPVSELEDNGWLRLDFAETLDLPEAVFVEISALGTQEGNAPTIRYSSEYDYRPGEIYISTVDRVTRADQKVGDLGLRISQ